MLCFILWLYCKDNPALKQYAVCLTHSESLLAYYFWHFVWSAAELWLGDETVCWFFWLVQRDILPVSKILLLSVNWSNAVWTPDSTKIYPKPALSPRVHQLRGILCSDGDLKHFEIFSAFGRSRSASDHRACCCGETQLKVVSDWYVCCSLPPGSVGNNVIVNISCKNLQRCELKKRHYLIRLSINWLKQNKMHLIN